MCSAEHLIGEKFSWIIRDVKTAGIGISNTPVSLFITVKAFHFDHERRSRRISLEMHLLSRYLHKKIVFCDKILQGFCG
jgi:hypothetical protein